MKLRPTEWKFEILIDTQFYMKSILAKFENQKMPMPLLQFQGLPTMNFGKFGTREIAQSYQN